MFAYIDEVGPLIKAGANRKTAKITRQAVGDGGSLDVDYTAVAGKLGDQGFQAGKLDEAITRLSQIDSRHLRALSPDDQARLAARLVSVRDGGQVRRFVNALDETSDVRRVLEGDVPATKRMSRLWANKDKTSGRINGLRYRHVDPDLEASDFVQIAQQVELKNTQLIVKRGDELRFLQRGTLEEGWKHIKVRHIEASYKLDAKEGTSFFPLGRTVKGNKLPDTMTKGEVKICSMMQLKMVIRHLRAKRPNITSSRNKMGILIVESST